MHASHVVVLKVQIVPFSRSISVDGSVTDLSGNGIAGQKVTIYRSTSVAGSWTAVSQLTTSSSGIYSAMLSNSAGVAKLRVVLSDDGTHVPITIDKTVGSLRMNSGNMANIMTNSTISNASFSSTQHFFTTFTLEETGTANVSIPKDSIAVPGLIGVLIDGIKGNNQGTETGDQYIFSLSNLKAGQISP